MLHSLWFSTFNSPYIVFLNADNISFIIVMFVLTGNIILITVYMLK